MYFKSPDNRSKINVPIGYKGTAFPSPSQPGRQPIEQADPIQRSFPSKVEKAIEIKEETPILPQKPNNIEGKHNKGTCDNCEQHSAPIDKKPTISSIFSSDSGLNAEELLILALALIVFQGSKENELALLLLALLFIK